ncbi:MAG: YdcF family protein [Alphaproteobacteria bacterium]
MTRLGRWLGRALRLAAVAAALLLAGFVWFAETIAWTPEVDLQPTDAIVVLTGSAERIPAAVGLLKEGRGRKLLVSGVNPTIDATVLMREMVGAAADPRITLDFAPDTRGNARETARWMAAEGFRSLRLVTANYHIRRAALELGRAMPGVAIVLHPVVSPQLRRQWWAWPRSAALIGGEYLKYLSILVRPWSHA